MSRKPDELPLNYTERPPYRPAPAERQERTTQDDAEPPEEESDNQ